MSALPQLETELAALYASPSQALPFAPSLHARAFVLRREEGNLLVYSVADLASASAAFERLGGVQRQYLGHWHEAMFAGNRLDVPLFVHEADRGQTERRTDVAGTFSEGQTLGGDFEIVPISGHTPGATAYLWDSGQQRLLFTGDTIYLSDGDWVAAVLDSSDRDAYIESLERLRELDFDVLVPWAATAGTPYYAVTDKGDAQRRIDAILERVRRGESG
jgi:glyoxylase-like metal-dependent hydrolase (beta-lactamase superfamily II)